MPAPISGIVIGGLDSEPLQDAVAELPGRPIDRIRHQKMVAGLEAGHQRDRDGGKARGRQHRSGGAGEVRPSCSSASVVGVPFVP